MSDALGEALPGEAREDVGEVQRRLDVVGVHVDEAVFLVVRAGPEILVRGADVAHVGSRDARRAVQQAGRDDHVVEKPYVGPVAVGNVAYEPVVTAAEFQSHPLADRARTPVAQARRKLALPQVARLHDVIVDRDDQREVFNARGGHRAAPFGRWTSAGAWPGRAAPGADPLSPPN